MNNSDGYEHDWSSRSVPSAGMYVRYELRTASVGVGIRTHDGFSKAYLQAFSSTRDAPRMRLHKAFIERHRRFRVIAPSCASHVADECLYAFAS